MPFEPQSDGCLMCGGELQLLGQFGYRQWYRCTWCGIDQYHIVNPEGVEEGIEDVESLPAA